ncbi:MAG: CDP-diacylglycerol--glycerol-3-phosphate 3-phosphatidyltransferase, partial [Coriobacteriaceae bacterium]|nr:CDP-diacylglycerol--glycerol-3-phosphate 3-phosphatidyltransferase [Coriobacteriaceae bacterium]
LRICGVPLFVVALLSSWPTLFPLWHNAEVWQTWVAVGIFVILAGTDGLDGYLARSRGEVTNFGKFVDPLADKILVAAALLALIELGVLPSWVALVILTREFIVSGIRMLAASQGVVIAASWYGKLKTVSQIFAIFLFIIKDSAPILELSPQVNNVISIVAWTVMLIALALTILSLIDYFVKAKPLLGFGGSSKGLEASRANNAGGTDARVATDDGSLNELAQRVVEAARAKNQRIGCAESCTGGLIAGTITSVSGSSEVFAGGIVSYSNAVKETNLGVSPVVLANFGAVSKEVACEMAQGARRVLGVDVAVAVTGIAGPEGGSVEKPIGTVWIAVSHQEEVVAERYLFEGDREQVRAQSVARALALVLDVLQ